MTLHSRFFPAAVATVLGLAGVAAQANMLTFEGGVLGGVGQSWETYTEDHFVLQTPEFFMAQPTPRDPSVVGLPDFSTRLFTGSYSVTMTASDNALFSAFHVDLGSFFGVNPLQAFVTFNGVRDDGRTVSQTFAAGAFLPFDVLASNDLRVPGHYFVSSMDTFQFSSDFTNLRSLSWDAIGRGAPGASAYYVDNLAVATVSPVPEPETWALMCAGLGLMAWVARRRRPEGARVY